MTKSQSQIARNLSIQEHVLKIHYHTKITVELTVLVGGAWSASHASHFTPRERAGWVGPSTALDDMEQILDPTMTRTFTPRLSSL